MARSPRPAALTGAIGLALAALLLPAAATAQRATRAPHLRAEVGASVASTPYLKDDNGARVAGGVAPVLGVSAMWDAGRRTGVGLGLRLSRVPTHAQESGRRLDADPTTHADLLGIASLALAPRATLRAGAGVSRLTGDATVVPFRAGNGAPWHPTGEIGVDVALTRGRPLWLALTTSATRLGAATVADPVRETGAVTRLLVGVRYGR